MAWKICHEGNRVCDKLDWNCCKWNDIRYKCRGCKKPVEEMYSVCEECYPKGY